MVGVGVAAVFGGVIIGGAATGIISGVALSQGANFYNAWMNGRTLVKVRTDDGRVIKLKRPDLLGTRIRASDDELGFKVEVRKGKKKEWHEGEQARKTVGAILPKLNSMGGKPGTVLDAVTEIESHGHPSEFLHDVADGDRFLDKKGVPGYINKMPKPTKLALEMALHEEQERRALNGELWLLERAWEQAEEIAAISDNLLLPEGADDFVTAHAPASGEGRALERVPRGHQRCPRPWQDGVPRKLGELRGNRGLDVHPRHDRPEDADHHERDHGGLHVEAFASNLLQHASAVFPEPLGNDTAIGPRSQSAGCPSGAH